MDKMRVSEEELQELNFGKTTLVLGIKVPGEERKDCLSLSLDAVKKLVGLLHQAIPVTDGNHVMCWEVPATERHEGLRLLAAWCEASIEWSRRNGADQ
jgi:hypothetical protein